MTAVTRKSLSKKSMRVATVFTGIAACTLGVTQAANAQDAARPVAKPVSKHIARAVRPAGRITGSIRYVEACANNHSKGTWFHYSTTVGYGGSIYIYTSYCFGYRGAWFSPPGTGILAECGGNNYGYLIGYLANHDSWFYHFGPGTGYNKDVHETSFYDVSITSWKGNDTCPIGPYYGGGNG